MRNVRKTTEGLLAGLLLLAAACVSAESGPQLAGPIMEARINGGPTVLSGTVINDGETPASEVTVTFIVRDGSGSYTFTEVLNGGEPLDTGEMADFTVTFEGSAERIEYSIGYDDQTGSVYFLR